jgi:hypothetical protein
MPMPEDHIVEHDGQIYAFGARRRPNFDPAELKYRLVVPPTVDFSKDIDLSPHFGASFAQGQMGSCTANAVVKLMMVLARIQGEDPPMLCRMLDYYLSRTKEQSFPQDAGAFPNDAFDAALAGLPEEAVWPYVADPAAKPPANLDTEPRFDYLRSHQPFYHTDPGGLAAGAVTALGQNKPFCVAIGWHQDWFVPHNGFVSWRDPNGPGWVGGHEICFGSFVPAGVLHPEMLFGFENSWGPGWPTDRHPSLPPGWAYMTARALETAMEARAASPEPVPPPPPPPLGDYGDRIMVAVRGKLVEQQAAAAARPHSITLRRMAEGGGQVRDAAEAVQR